MSITRRVVLAAGLSGVLSACAVRARDASNSAPQPGTRTIAPTPTSTTPGPTSPFTPTTGAARSIPDIANHGTRHLPLSVRGRSAYGIPGTTEVGEVYDEVEANARKLLRLLGHPVSLFRSGTAHYDDVATRIVHDLGEQVIGFDVNGDVGATLTCRQVAEALRTVRPGSIVISHMNHPGHGTAAGMRAGLPAVKDMGYRFVHVAGYVH